MSQPLTLQELMFYFSSKSKNLEKKASTAILFCLRGSEMQLLIYVQILLKLASSKRGIDDRSQGKASINFVMSVLGNLII